MSITTVILRGAFVFNTILFLKVKFKVKVKFKGKSKKVIGT